MDDHELRDNLLHDFVHCSVCSNIFTDPKQLSCLHTFCGGCIARITLGGSTGLGVMQFTGLGTRSRNITCPICRAETSVTNIKPDFRTNDLVSRFQNFTIPLSEYPCAACAIETRDIEWKCVTCDMLICGFCREAHVKFPVTADHNIISVSEVARLAKQQLSARKVKFIQADAALHKQLNTLFYYKEHILNQKLQAETKIDKDCSEVVKKLTDLVTTYANSMKTTIANAESNENAKVNQLVSEIVSHRDTNKDAQNRIQELLEWEDEKKVAFESQNGLLGDPQIHHDRYDMKEKLLFHNSDFVSKVIDAVTGNAPNIRIEKTDFGNPNIQMSPLNKGRLSTKLLTMQASSQWTPEGTSTLNHSFQRLCLVGDNLWLCISGLHTISVFSIQERNFVKQIKNDGIRYPMALSSTTNGNLILACGENKGLVELEKDGNYIKHIETSGSYHDISICGNDMAVLEVSTGIVYVYQFNDSSWGKKYEVKPEVNDPLNSILMHYGLLIVGSIKGQEENRVIVYEKGKVLKKYPISGEFVRVCCTDQHQSILISHGRDNNLLVLRKPGESEQLVVVNGVFYPLDVVFSDDVTMWVLQRTTQGTVIMKCIKNELYL